MHPSNLFVSIANSPRRLFIAFASTMAAAAIAYSLIEKTDLIDALYWVIVTATTLGYGDLSPHTTPGKVLTAVLITAMVFVFIPTITANIASKLIVNRDAFTHEEQEDIKEMLRRVEVQLSRASDREEGTGPGHDPRSIPPEM